jgi:hypothetical protein
LPLRFPPLHAHRKRWFLLRPSSIRRWRIVSKNKDIVATFFFSFFVKLKGKLRNSPRDSLPILPFTLLFNLLIISRNFSRLGIRARLLRKQGYATKAIPKP